MNPRRQPRIVLLGRLSTMPFGGVVWQVLHYLLGLDRLGFEAYYIEAHAVTPRHFIGRPGDDGSAAAAAFLENNLCRFGFQDRWALHALHSDGRFYGMSRHQVSELYREAEAVINLHGGTSPNEEQSASRRLVCVATDPVQIELELHKGVPATIDFFNAHDTVLSFGENYGRDDCLLPVTEGFPILPTRQPVVLDLWEGDDKDTTGVFTTVANWNQKRDLQYAGETYGWSKHTEFLKLLDLPRRTRRPLELALTRCPQQHQRLLRKNGWRVRDALEISGDLDTYRRYITGSRAEFTVAKDQNVRLRSGWFSDRSATYLAAGLPVVTQDTGFGNVLPTGEGLFAFADVDGAVAGIQAIDADIDRHRRAAREIAREYFAHDVVLGDLLTACGVEMPTRGRRVAERRPPLRTLLVSHRLPPDAVGGVERYTETLGQRLRGRGHVVSAVSRAPGKGELRREVDQLPAGPTVHRLVGGRFGRERFLQERRRRLKYFREVLVETEPDVVHVNHVLDLSPGILRIARERGAAVVLTLHDYYFACHRIVLRTPDERSCEGPRGGLACAQTCFSAEGHLAARRWSVRTTYFRRLLDLADRLICPSQHVADFFARIGAPAERLRVVPNGIWLDRPDPEDQGAAGREGERLSLAFLGPLLEHKGLEDVLEALELAQLEAVDLTVFGSVGDEVRARRAYARADEIPGLRYRVFGEYEPSDLPPLLRQVDCVVVPSRWPETFCLVAWEALALGVPVLVSRIGALPDAVEEGVNGFVFEPEEPERLAAVLRRLATEPDLLPRLRDGARGTRSSTLARHVEAIEEVYREAIDRVARRPAVPTADLDEIEALEESLEALGFGDPEEDPGQETDRLEATPSTNHELSRRQHAGASTEAPSLQRIDSR